MPEATENGDDNYLEEEDQDGGTDDLEIGAHYKNPFFTNAENIPFPNGWIAVNYLQPNGDVLERYQQPHFNQYKARVGFKLLINLAHWSGSIECECSIDESHHP